MSNIVSGGENNINFNGNISGPSNSYGNTIGVNKGGPNKDTFPGMIEGNVKNTEEFNFNNSIYEIELERNKKLAEKFDSFESFNNIMNAPNKYEKIMENVYNVSSDGVDLEHYFNMFYSELENLKNEKNIKSSLCYNFIYNLEYNPDLKYDDNAANTACLTPESYFNNVLEREKWLTEHGYPTQSISDPIKYNEGIEAFRKYIDEEYTVLFNKYFEEYAKINDPNYSGMKYDEYINRINAINSDIAMYKASIYSIEQQKKILPYNEIMQTEEFMQYMKENNIDDLKTKFFSCKKENNSRIYLENQNNNTESIPYSSLSDYVSNISYLSDESIYICLYLYDTQGYTAAADFLKAIEDSINQAKARESADKFLASITTSTGEIDYNGLTARLTAGKGTLDGVETFIEGLVNLYEEDAMISVNQYEQMYILEALSNPAKMYLDVIINDLARVDSFRTGSSEEYIKNNYDFYNQDGTINLEYAKEKLTAEQYDTLLKKCKFGSAGYSDIYQISSSIGNMLPSIAISSVVSILATPTVGSIVGSSLMGASAGGNAKMDAMIAGNDSLSSTLYGLLSGLSETTLGLLLGNIPGLNANAKFALEGLIGEGTEELIQTFVDAGLRAELLGEEIDITQLVGEGGKSFVYGLITAGILNGGNLSSKILFNNTKANISNVNDLYNLIKIFESNDINVTKKDGKDIIILGLDVDINSDIVSSIKSIFPEAEIKQIVSKDGANVTIQSDNIDSSNNTIEVLDNMLSSVGEINGRRLLTMYIATGNIGHIPSEFRSEIEKMSIDEIKMYLNPEKSNIGIQYFGENWNLSSNFTFKEKTLIKLLLANDYKKIVDGKIEEINSSNLLAGNITAKLALNNIINDENLLYKLIINAYGKNNDSISKEILNILINSAISIDSEYERLFTNNYFKILVSKLSATDAFEVIFNMHVDNSNLVYNISNILEGYSMSHDFTKEDIDLLVSRFIEQFNNNVISLKTTVSSMMIIFIGNTLKQKGNNELLNYWQESIRKIFETKVSLDDEVPNEYKNEILNSLNQNLRMYINNKITDKTLELILEELNTPDYIGTEKYITSLSYTRTLNNGLSGLNFEQIRNCNVKIINQILDVAIKKYAEESGTFNFPNYLFVNIYIAFGKQKTIDLIEGKYGEVSLSELEYMFSSIDVKKYQIPQKNGNVVYTQEQQALINFLFASGANDINANIKKFISGEILSKEISVSRIISEWDLHYQVLNGKVTLSALFEQFEAINLIIPANLKGIESILKRAGLDYYDLIKNTYEEMQKRTKSTIPKIKQTIGEYEYEMLDLNDIGQMHVGYDTHCCFTFEGASESSLIDGCTSKDSRIFVVRKNGNLIAQSWVWRNGNVVCFDDIETAGVTRKYDQKLFEIYEVAAQEIIDVTGKSNEPIELVTIGVINSKIDLPGTNLSKQERLLPLKGGLYTDAYEQVILSTSSDYNQSKSYKPKAIYQDERKQTIAIDIQIANIELINNTKMLIDKINCTLEPETYKECQIEEEYTYLVCGQDWYIGITSDGKIECKSISYDERSKEEINQAILYIKEKINAGEISANLNNISSKTIVEVG